MLLRICLAARFDTTGAALCTDDMPPLLGNLGGCGVGESMLDDQPPATDLALAPASVKLLSNCAFGLQSKVHTKLPRKVLYSSRSRMDTELSKR